MKALYITQEYAPLFAEGGLALTSNALPATLQTRRGITHDLVLPYYPWLIERGGLRTEVVLALPEREVAGVRSDAEVHRLLDHGGTCEIFLLRADAWYDRGGIYRDANYTAFADEGGRAAFFGWCVADWLEATSHDYDLIHGNDWQSGAALAHLRDRFPGLKQVLTIHNALYQGRLQELEPAGLGLPAAQVARLTEHAQGSPSLFLLGLLAADAAVTCSPTYAYELVEEFRGSPVGDALERLHTTGIVFGVDGELWDPAGLDRSTVPYDSAGVDEGKRLNKQALQKHLELTEDDTLPVVGVCSRVVPEKGSDLLIDALAPLLRERRVQLVLVGPSTDELHARLRALSAEAPGLVGYVPQFDQDTAWLVYAGADLTVMPSRIEPCGLNQLIAYGYGTLPIASPVGGLYDTVTDLRTDPDGGGLVIPEHTAESVRSTVVAALEWMRDEPAELTAVRRRVMAQDWSWAVTAREYAELYTRLTGPTAV
ncbi:glycogen/starch synthase [Streptomyces sp. NPDC032472]|uniref:glycogen synthase n=1 Tax=Streptomyces sp. NPDC032472 TaxID=3155018 RepID=UPI0033EB1A4A